MKFTKETGKRMLRTFIQTIIGYIAVNLAIVDFTAEKEVIKSALIGLVISALSAGLSAIMNLQSTANIEEKGGADTITFSEFLEKYKVGNSYAYNGTYKGECVSLVKCFIKEVLGVTPQSIGNAKDYWSKRSSSYIKSMFTALPNTPSFVPQRGDVFVRTSGTYGHIGIVLEATTDYFYTIEQNHNGCRVVKNIKHTDWKNINFLRPKNQNNIKEQFAVGKTYTLTTNVKVRTGAGTSCRQKKISELNSSGRIRCTSQNKNDYAVLKKGVTVTAKAVKTIGSDVWIEIINGWVCVKYNGTKYAK